MNPTQRREKFRAILAGSQCVNVAAVFDTISARIAELLGFQLGMMSTVEFAAAVLGAPEIGELMTLSELQQQVRRICRASSISLFVNAEGGYGNALNVMRTVEEIENAGAAGISITDEALPIGLGVKKGARLVSTEEGVGKIKAAVAARQDPSLVIVARTLVLGTKESLPEAIRRLKAYESAGVDAIHLARPTREGVEAVHAEIKLPLTTGGAHARAGDIRFLTANGVRVIEQGHTALRASMKGVHDALKAVRDGKSPAEVEPLLASEDFLDEVTRRADYNRWTKEYWS